MAGHSSWTVTVFVILFEMYSAQVNDKGLVVSTFPNWAFNAQLQVFHSDPSTFNLTKSIGLTKMDVGGNSQVTSLVANTRNDSLIVLDAYDNTIYNYENFNLYMNHTSKNFSKVHTGVSASTSQIAVDWLTGNVYWTDGFYKWIATHPLSFPNNASVYKIIISTQLTKPEGIAVDPFQRLLFWSDVIGPKSKIERSTLIGGNRTIIVQSDIPIWVSSLALDTDNQMLYWADIGRQTIEYCDYNGNNRKVLRRILGSSFLSISMSKMVVCATEYKYLDVLCFNKTNGNTTWLESYMYQEPWAVTVYDSEQQKIVKSGCDSKSCDHLCFNTGDNTATCACKEGYILMGDGKSCQSENGLLFGKSIIIANSTVACMFDIHLATNIKPVPDCILTNLTALSNFVVDSHTRLIYYSSIHSIQVVDMITKSEKVLYTNTMATISGLSFNWITKNIYWTDSAGGKILLHSTYTRTTTDLITSLDNPRYITVDPHNRKMYWIQGTGYSSNLQESNLDGTGQVTILKKGEIASPAGLYYDTLSQKLYWINNGDLVSMGVDGSNAVYHAYTGLATDVLVYKDYSYWTTGDGYVDIAHLDSYYADVSIKANYMGSLAAIGVYDVDVQPMELNNCTNFNGGCQHICLPTGSITIVCLCNFGYILQSDGKSCSNTPFEDSFALIPDVTHDKIYQVSLSDGELRALDIPDVDVPVSVIYDKPTAQIYWTNALRTEIRASKLKSTTSNLIYDTSSVLPVGLAFDYSSGLLYFTTEYWSKPSYIGCVHPHVGKHLTLIKDLDLPKNIALDPKRGLMCWTDIATSSTKTSYIGCANMDGTSKFTLVGKDINSPNGIVFDYSSERVYWADADLSRIESVKLDGSDRRILVVEPGAALVGLDISPPYLYYVGRNKQQITKIDLGSNTKVSFMNDIHALGRIESVRVSPIQTQPLNTYCATKNGECALFCLPTPTGRTCGCEDGESLLSDGKTCTGHISCDINIPNAILDDRCIGHATGSCNYTCANGYAKAVDILTCDAHGNWNQPINSVCQSLTGTCPADIPHGYVTSQCDRKIGSICAYTCNAGYIPDPQNSKLTCQATGAWNIPVANLCTVSKVFCPTVISNGQIEPSCTFSSGTQCDFSCNAGYSKNTDVTKLVCLVNGIWSFNGDLCVPDSSVKCKNTLSNGAFDPQCTFNVQKTCKYTCNSGYSQDKTIDQVMCMDSGTWSVAVDTLCTKALAPCSKSVPHGRIKEPCSAMSGVKCDYECDAGYLMQPIVVHLLCIDGSWTVKTDSLCIAQSPPGVSSQKQTQDSGTSGGAVAGIVIAAVIITIVVVLGIVYFLWWRKRPQGQYVSNNTNLKFQRFDDSNVPAEGVTGFSNPIANQSEYGNFSSLRDEGYVTTDTSPNYDQVDPKEVRVDVEKRPTTNGVYANSDA